MPRDRVCGLDYLFTISGVARIVSTDPLGFPRVSSGLPSARAQRPAVKVSPIQCDPLFGFGFPAKAPSCAFARRMLKGRCSIQMSYGR